MEGQWALKRRSHSVVAECHARREWLPAISRPRMRQARFDSLILVGLMQAACTPNHTKFYGWLGSTTQKHTRCTRSSLPFPPQSPRVRRAVMALLSMKRKEAESGAYLIRA
jgi:hypothetical protein